ncbi:MAG: hypothetical protein WCG85_15990, partial [Polyangia bacterium]
MPGPKTPQDALVWVKDAMAAGRYIPDPHFEKRCRQRHFSVFDAKRIAATATTCVPYLEAEMLVGGTAWRVFGRDSDGDPAALGVE